MTDHLVDVNRSTSVPPPPPELPDSEPSVASRAPVPWVPIATALVTIGVLVVVVALRFDGWRWLAVGGAAIATALAAPAHVWAFGHVKRQPVAALASAGSLVALAGAVVAATGGDRADVAVPSGVAATGLALLHHFRDSLTRTTWLHPAAAVIVAGGAAAWWLTRDSGSPVAVAAAVLVAASPAAVGLSAPAALASARGRTRRGGVELPDGEAALAAAETDTLLIDLHGTVTTGDLKVTSVDPVEEAHERNLRWFAGALEHASDHRIGHAIAKLSGRGRLSNVQQFADTGISGSVDRHPVRVGRLDWLGIEAPASMWTTVGVEVDARQLGTITVAEAVRDDTATALTKLKRLGLPIVAVSSARPDRARHLADSAGLNSVVTTDDGDVVPLGVDRAGDRALAFGPLVAPAGVVPDAATKLGLRDSSLAKIATALEGCRAAAKGVRVGQAVGLGLGVVGALFAATGIGGPLAAAAWAVIATASTTAIASSTR